MKQVVQGISGGPVRVEEVPVPTIGAAEVLVRTVCSTLSPGTERAVTALAQSSLIDKARARPDLVRQVVKKARTEGVAQTVQAVRARLEGDMPLGYSAAGVAVEVGDAVSGVVPGQRVATAGAGRANHAEFQSVPALLCAPIPDGVTDSEASFATIGAIALHGFRLAGVEIGSKVVIVGMGLVGQLATRLALAAGCDVAGIDIADHPLETARAAGVAAFKESGAATTDAVLRWTHGRGADAVLVTSGGKGSEVMSRVPEICRDRAGVVVVGDVGLQLSRAPYYERELTIKFARSYGPGRYERSYEEWGVDYPAGLVRWSEGRNLECVLDLVARKRLAVADLVSHTFAIEDAAAAYELIEAGTEPYLGIQLEYPARPAARTVRTAPAVPTPRPGVGLVGAGAFARTVLVPALRAAGFDRFVAVASASGSSARNLATSAGFETAVTGADDVIDHPDVSAVVIATPHSSHAELATKALSAGKHVFCEKPLALSLVELEEVESAAEQAGRVLYVGFNRRWSPAVALVRRHFAAAGPLAITYRVNAGAVPPSHWYHDRREGGRLLGEVCHFVDTCAVLAGAPPVVARAEGSGPGELLLKENLVVTLGFSDGTLASIVYTTGGHHSTEKETIEILGGGRTGRIVDFREVILDGKRTALKGQDKGHRAQMQAFYRAITGSEIDPGLPTFIESMRATLRAASSLGSGTTTAHAESI